MRSLLIKALVILSPFTVATAHASEPFVLTTEEYPPFNMTFQGQITGISTDLVRAVFDKAGVAYKIEMLPWSRAINMAETQKNTCVYSTTETEERKNRFEWIGPLTENNWVLFGKSDQAPMQSLEEARGKTVGGYTGDAISLYLEKEGYKVETAPRDDLNLAKLINGRIDYWATGSELGPYLAQQQGAPGAIKPLLTFKKTVMSVACHKDSDPAALEKLRAALREVRKN